jgi:hypothetical protein
MRFLGLLTLFLEGLSSWQFSYAVLSVISMVWCLYLVPIVLTYGLVPTIESINDGTDSLLISVVTFTQVIMASVLIWSITITRLLFITFFGQLSFAEQKLIIEKLLNENMPLQFCVVLVGESQRNVIETLIWSFVFIFYSCCNVVSTTARYRLQNNNIRGLRYVLFTLLVACSAFMGLFTWLLSEAGFFMLLLVNYEGILVLMESSVTYYQLLTRCSFNSQQELTQEIIETLIKILQWLHLSVTYGSWFSANPLQFLILFKLQGDASILLSGFKKFKSYKNSMKLFLSRYPPLSSHQQSLFKDESCSICWETLSYGATSCLPCGHAYHIDCIKSWILSNSANTCPLCKRPFLESDEEAAYQNIYNVLMTFRQERNDEAAIRIHNVLPHIPIELIRNHLEVTQSINDTVNHFVGVNVN